VVAAGLLMVIAAGSVAAFQAVWADADLTPDAAPPVNVKIPEGFPVVPPPSYRAASPAPTASLPASAPAGSSPTPAGPGPSRTTPSRKASRTTAPATATSPTRQPEANGPISAYSACSTGAVVRFKATFAGSYAWHHVFIDADGDAGTGYRGAEGGGIGADYMIENEHIYESTGADWGWTLIDTASPLVARSGGSFRWQVRPGFGGVRVVFGASTDSGDVSTSVVAVRDC
jgi:hypothetical protein